MPRGEAARHEKVPRPLRGRAREHGRLDLDEALAVEVVARRAADLIPQQEVPQHRRPAEIQVPVLEPQGLGRLLGLVEREGQGLRLVQDAQTPGRHLDLARGEVGVHGARRPPLDRPLHRQDELHPDPSRDLVGRGVDGGVEHELRHPVAVPEVHEDEAAVIAAPGRPPHQGDRPAGVAGAQCAARMRAAHPSEGFRHVRLPDRRGTRSANHCTLGGPSPLTVATPS